MSRIVVNVVLSAWFGVASPLLADSIPAANSSPVSTIPLRSPEIPTEVGAKNPQFQPTSIPHQDQPEPVVDLVARQANISNFGSACGPSLSVAPAFDAMMAVYVYAPCLPYDVVRLEHEGLSFTVPMPMTGELTLLVPALSANAEVKAKLSDGTNLSASTNVPDADSFVRVALQWNGADPGELIAKAPKVLDGSVIHLGKSMGNDGSVLHVFSTRVGEQRSEGVVRLSMLAPVTSKNCDEGHSTKVRRQIPGEPTSSYDLLLKGPGCGAIGQSLELKNVLQDLKLSQN